jgi:monovalent cation:proton antiporter-2 (CPA2) family protein
MDQNSFLFSAMMYLAAAVVFVPIARKLGLGSVLGYLVAGVVIGPFVLGFVGQEGQDVMHYAEFGVVMMLFLIGLELEPGMLWRLRKSVLGLGSLQVFGTTAVIVGILMALDFHFQQALAIGLIIAMSSTAIVMQSLREKGLTRTGAGQSAFSVLLFQDIAVIPMLALFPLLATLPIVSDPASHKASTWVEGQPIWIHALIIFGSVTGIVLGGRLLVRPLLRQVAKSGIREVFTASALLIVVAIASLMMQVGLSPALGAFLAGVVLANSEFRHELESDIEPFKGLLLGLFFIAVGASIDFSLVAAQPLQLIGCVLGILVIKTAVLMLAGRSFKLGLEQSLILSFSLSQVGEFAFVLLSFAAQEGILGLETVSFMIAVVAVSMALTPLAMMFNEKVLLPRLGTDQEPELKGDEIDERNPVIIAGFGHFGSTVGRFLRAGNIKATYLDIDSDRVDHLRKMGFKVFYGDASRHELLHAAGAAEARLFIITIGNAEKRMEMIHTVKKHFPNLRILVRSANRYEAYDQMNAGMLHIYRETLDCSIRLGVDALTLLGYRNYTAKRMGRSFLKHDEKNLKKLASIHNQEEYISAARQNIEDIELLLRADADGALVSDSGWDAESLREDRNP